MTDAVPEFAPIPTIVARFGLSRTRLYELAADGRVRFIKAGSRTLVDVASVRALLASLPPARLRASVTRDNAA